MVDRREYLRIIEENKRLIKELEKSRGELLRQKIRFDRIANAFDDLNVNILDKDFVFVYVNENTKKFFDFVNYPILGSSVLDLSFSLDDTKISTDEILHQIRDRGKIQLEIFGRKEILEVEISCLLSDEGDIEGYMIISDNITEQSEAKNEMLKLSTAIEQSANVIVITDTKGNIEYVNDSFCRSTGYTKEEVLGQNSRILKSGKQDKKFYKKLWDTIIRGETWQGIFENINKQGYPYWERATISPIRSGSGEIRHYLAIKEDITEIVVAEKKLKENEEKYRNLFETSNDAIVILDDTNHFVDCNQMACTLFGFEKDEIIGKTPADLSPEFQPGGESSLELSELYIRRIRKGDKQKFEWLHQRKDGTLLPAEVSLHNLPLENAPLLYAIIRNLSDVQKIQNELQKSEERFKLLSNISFEGIIIHDKGKILDVNLAMTRITGYSFEEITSGGNIFFAIHPDYHELVREKMTISRPAPYEIEIIHKDGHFIPVEIVSNWISFGDKILRVSAVRDISRRKKVEKALTYVREKAEYNEGILQTYINAVPDIICFKDEKGRWLMANDAVLRLYHLTDVDYIGKTDEEIARFAHPQYENLFLQWAQKDKEIWESHKPFHEMDELNTIEGEKRIFDVIKIPLYYPDNRPKGMAIIGRDVTEFHRIQEELIVAKEAAEESNLLKTRFLNNMSHEIRTPMNGIIGFSSLLKENTNIPPEKQKLYINIIQNSSKQLLRIIDDILEISYLETKRVETKKEVVCINNLLLEAFSVFELKAKEKNVAIYFNSAYTDSESSIYSDQSKINKIIHNLIENAIKFTHQGYIEIGYTIDENVNIFVKDTGIGIHKSKQDTIFNRFAQEDKVVSSAVGGLGLGLSIAQENAALLGGKISVESEKGKGSIFTLSIPYIPFNDDSGLSPSGDGRKKDDAVAKKILLAEDEEVNYLFFNILVTKIIPGIKIIHAKNGRDAVNMFKDEGNFDMIFMDIKMPDMDGYEAIRQIRTFDTEIPVVALTAYSSPDDREKALSSGFTDFISKPIDGNGLSEMLKKYL